MRRYFAPLAVLLALFLSPVVPAAAQTTIVAVVNGKPITSYDVSQRQKLLRLTGTRSNLHQVALDELIDEKVQLEAAQAVNITASDADIDRAIGEIASRIKMSPSQLTKGLASQGVNISTLRDRLRAQIAFNRLVRARFQSSLTVSEQDLVAALRKDDSLDKKIETAEYNLTQVMVALPEKPSPQRLADAKRRAADVRAKFTNCRDGLAMAKKTREVVVRPFGRRTAAELTPDARAVLEDVPVGRLSEPIEVPRGLVMFAVCDKKIIKSTNAAMKALEPDMNNERGEAFAKQYLRQLRRDAVIERR
ncbi:SurA N-terminal domain-containing protein [Acuticoccus mangrovi]|uniref:SurA N-terminal domain-containing protein n=1 Tax=Acuticoccus mangrovi TaxID=2796142 RepID=A0A934IRE4_9HYPH|nr:SurA N-terminal domain-containing protein [Acuticoccus mangrovi]MBJ3776670.1 SurA N-terminal domain-containing protein [Acuticoccus mangrovi]